MDVGPEPSNGLQGGTGTANPNRPDSGQTFKTQIHPKHMIKDEIDLKSLESKNPIKRTLERIYNLRFEQQGDEFYTKCPFHTDGKRPNFRINERKNSWFCDVCDSGGGIVQFLMKKEGIDFKASCERLGWKPAEQSKVIDISGKVPVATYDYLNEVGELIFQVCRFHVVNREKDCGYDKTFRQRRPGPNGEWINDMQGVERIPYCLPEIIGNKSAMVNIVEGEKDAETLRSLTFCATTNVGGAGKWLAGYGEYLSKRDVAIWPDNDEPGREHAQDIFSKLLPHARSIRMMMVPPPHKDVTDWIKTIPNPADAEKAVSKMLELATPLYGGVDLPFSTIQEIEPLYRKQCREADTTILSLSKWIPSLNRAVRGMVPGEVGTLIANTGQGKTAWLSNLAIQADPIETLIFELELPAELMFERFVAAATRTRCEDVFESYRIGNGTDYSSGKPLSHIQTCCKTGLGCDDIERMIDKAELKTGTRPVLVIIDYIQLLSGFGKSRYERTSESAEKIKAIAKKTGTIIFVASQVGRDEDNPEVGLYDAKDSGSIENSSGLVIGIWREPGPDKSLMKMKILKQTKGVSGAMVDLNFDGERMLITERSKISDADIPYRKPHLDP